MACRINVGPGDRISIHVDDQHISRITHAEARDIIAQLLVFGGSRLREEIGAWLQGGKIDDVAEFIAPKDSERS